jgi:hypothetical protein
MSNTVILEFNPNIGNYFGYVVWSELNNPTIIGGSSWGLNNLVAVTSTTSGSASITFSPTLVNNINPFWFIQTSSGIYAPQKQTQSFLYIEDEIDTLNTTYIYQSKILSNTLTTPYGTYLICPTIRIFSTSYTLLQENQIEQNTYGTFTLSITNNQPSGTYKLQWGIMLKGYPVYPADTRNFGNFIFSDINATCYNKNTNILCFHNDKEIYIPIQDLKEEMLVCTYKQGYKKIKYICSDKMVNNPLEPKKCMFKLKQNKMDGLTEDLIVTGLHSILVDTITDSDRKIEDKYLESAMSSELFEKLDNYDTYNYYHIVLENNNENLQYGIYANGILSESMSEFIYKTVYLTDNN